jgi:hypothetical protein
MAPVLQPTVTERDLTVKRIIAAVSLAVLAAPVFAAEIAAPFEQTQFDRVLTNVEQRASAGSTGEAGVWAHDYNFIAPAQ